MAVYQPDQVNLAPAYANIIEALKSQTEIAANQPPSTLSLLAGVAGKAGGAYVGQKIGNKLDVEKQGQLSDMELAKQKDLSTFQSKLQQDLEQSKEKYKLEGEGKILLDDAGIQSYFQQQGIDPKFAPKVPPGSKIWLDPKQITNKVKHAEFLTEVEKASEIYLKSNDPEDKKYGSLLKILSNVPEGNIPDVIDALTKSSGKGHRENEWVQYTEPRSGERGAYLRGDPSQRISLSSPEGPDQDNILDKIENYTVNQRQLLRTQQTKVSADPVIKDLRDVRSKIGNLKGLIIQNIPQGLGVVQSQIARILALEKGALSEGDVGRTGGGLSAQQVFNRFKEKISTGKMSSDDLNGFIKLIDTMERNTKDVIENTTRGYVDQILAEIPNADPEFIKTRIMPPIAAGIRIQKAKKDGELFWVEVGEDGKVKRSLGKVK